MVLASASQLSYNRAEMRISKMIFTFYLVQASHIKQTESEILRIYNIYASCGLSQGIICKKDGDGRHFMCTLYIISLTLWCREEVVIRLFCLQSSSLDFYLIPVCFRLSKYFFPWCWRFCSFWLTGLLLWWKLYFSRIKYFFVVVQIFLYIDHT